jgi:serine/threonine-protein kinase
MMTALEIYLYSDGYGPTNEKLGVYLKQVMGFREPGSAPPPAPLPP